MKNKPITYDVVRETMSIVSKDVRLPKVFRDGRINKREKIESLIEEYAHEAFLIDSERGEQPAGYGCGFGVRKEGEVGVENLLKEFIKDYKEIESE